MQEFEINIPVFEGPMDLLLHVIRRHEVELYEVPLSRIAKDFLSYARQVHHINLDLAGEILYIATTIMRMKVRSLLPREENPEVQGEESDLIRDDELDDIYREIVAAARILAKSEEHQRKQFARGDGAEIIQVDETEEVLKDISIVQLAEAFRKVTRRLENRPTRQLALFTVTIEDQARLIVSLLRDRKRLSFTELSAHIQHRVEAVIAFLALLNILRRHFIRVKQQTLNDEVWIYRGKEYPEDDEWEANGVNFDDE